MNKLKRLLIQAFCLGTPLFYCGYDKSYGWPAMQHDRYAQERFYVLSAMSVIGFFSESIWIGMFMAWNIYLYVYQGMDIGSNWTMNLFVGIVLFIISKEFFRRNSIESIRTPILIVSAISLIWMALQGFGIDPLFFGQTNGGEIIYGVYRDFSGIFHIRMANGIYLLIGSILMFTISPIISLAMTLPIIIFSHSSSVMMAIGSWLLLLSWYKVKRYFKYILPTIIFLGLLGTYIDYKNDPKTFVSRFPVWHSCVRYSLSYPLGYGPDSYRNYNKHKQFLFKSDGDYHHGISWKKSDSEEQFQFYSITNDRSEAKKWADETMKRGSIAGGELNLWDNPHNLILQILFQYGIIGLVILIGFLRELCIRFKHAFKDLELIAVTGCIMAYFMAGMTNFPLEMARTAYIFPLLLGLFWVKTEPVI